MRSVASSSLRGSAEQPVVDLGGRLALLRDPAPVRRDESAHDIDRLGADARGAVVPAAQRAAKTQHVRRQQQEARHIGRLERAREPAHQAMPAAAVDKIAQRRNIDVIEQPAAGLVRRIDHRARKTALAHEPEQRRIDAVIREHDADDLYAPRDRAQGADAFSAPAIRKQRDLDVVDAGLRQHRYGAHQRVRFHRELARDSADAPTVADGGERRRHHIGRDRPERAVGRILQVDDVGAVPHGNLGFVGSGDACEHKGHRDTPASGASRPKRHKVTGAKVSAIRA
jgi:hypothetical protein